MSHTVAVSNMSKWFGNKVAVSEVTVGFSPGVTGLLGPNGAGKTTLMRVVAGLQVPSQGSISVLGEDPRANPDIYSKLVLVPEDEAIYERMTGRAFITLAAQLSGVDDVARRVQQILETVELVDAADRNLGGFSKGMRQRAKVAAALVSEPEVLLLDEPLNGADPVQRASLIALFRRLGAEGRTVIVSSHVLIEVERMTDQVVAMVDGRLAAVGDIADIRAAMSDKPRQVFVESMDPRGLGAALLGVDGVVGVRVDEGRLTLETSDAVSLAKRLPHIAVEGGFEVSRVEPVDESLESVFRYLVEGE
ncbi:MAG: ABC transporter ATP-binding protein [Acidimicrobiia bacterium]|nr:ABC transporter ATP-binding protein [Acidimicrobiia bacterium]MDH3462760.1 ABC transporter ATP-binding protein [Acidimicrobiia bacterium]